MELYDKKDPQSIELYGRKMIGKSFRQIWEENLYAQGSGLVVEHTTSSSYAKGHARKRYKGGLGNLIEECYFKYKSNSDANPDFPEAGVELKVTPYKKAGNTFSAKERLVLTMIDYHSVVKEADFLHSHVWHKSKLILLVWYLYQKEVPISLDYIINFVKLFTPPKEDLEIMKEDYNKIVAKIRAGKAHELSEGDTLYLGACTKAPNGEKETSQPFSNLKAKPRAFSFKNSYMTQVFRKIILNDIDTYEPIVPQGTTVTDFESYVQSKISSYKGMSQEALCDRFDVDPQKVRKGIRAILTYRMLGIKGNHADEFEKAGIVVKTILFQSNGTIKEHMSFPQIDFVELAEENWEDCAFGSYLRETRFFFVTFKKDESGNCYLAGCQFWNMPVGDLEGDVREVWQETHDIISQGRLHVYIDDKGKFMNNLPKQKDHPIAHVRPHARTALDMSPLPEGTHVIVTGNTAAAWDDDTKYTKQCFWLRNSYIAEQINDENK